MTKEWSHLPNAAHIDWALKTLEKDSEMWGIARDVAWEAAGGAARADALDAARGATWDAARDDAWAAARGAVWDATWDAARGVAWGAARGVAWDDAWRAGWGAIAALIAWDNSAELLDKSVEEVTELARAGNHAAVLMLSAVIVKNKLKEMK